MKDRAEDIVRRAAAAFNAGQADEARKLCEQGLARSPREPMLSHLLAAMLFAQLNMAAARFHIEGIPTLLIFKSGKLVDRLVGAHPKQTIVEHLEKQL